MAKMTEIGKMTGRLRRILAAKSMTQEEIEAVVGATVGVKENPLKKFPRATAKRILSLLLKPGDKCMVTRAPTGLRVYPDGYREQMREKMHRVKPWIVSPRNGTKKATGEAVTATV